MEHLISKETQEKFFVFMKKLTDENFAKRVSTFKFKSDLDLKKFSNAGDFIGGQTSANYCGEDIEDS